MTVLAAGAEAVNCMHGVVEMVSFVGGLTRITVRTSDGGQIVLKSVSTRSEERTQPGMAISLTWSPADSIVLAA